MDSAWGDAWGFSWGEAWGELTTTPTTSTGGGGSSRSSKDEDKRRREQAFLRKMLQDQFDAAQLALKNAREADQKPAPKAVVKRVNKIASVAKSLLEKEFIPTPKLIEAANKPTFSLADIERQIMAVSAIIRMQEDEEILLLLSY